MNQKQFELLSRVLRYKKWLKDAGWTMEVREEYSQQREYWLAPAEKETIYKQLNKKWNEPMQLTDAMRTMVAADSISHNMINMVLAMQNADEDGFYETPPDV